MQGTREHQQPDVRARMAEVGLGWPRPLRELLQAYLTWLTGKPRSWEERGLRLGPLADTALTLLVLACGVALSLLALRLGPKGWVFFIPGWIATTGALRKLFIVVQHGFVHGALPGGRGMNAAATDALAILALLPPYGRYREEHVVRHHGARFAGADDPDGALLLRFGMSPGTSRTRLWQHFALTLVSPGYHALFARTRVTGVFLYPSRSRRLAAIATWSAVLIAVELIGAWSGFVFAWLIPALPCFHAAALVSIAGEHTWFVPRTQGESMARYQRRLTSARFVGSPPPSGPRPPLRRAGAWVHWWIAHLTYWPAVRVALVPGDLPAHDFHHMEPNVPWTETLRARQAALERGEHLTEVWGAFAAVDRTFRSLARLPAVTPLD